MNKIMGISLIAVLAVSPVIAMGATGDIVPGDPLVLSSANPAQAEANVTAANAPKYALKTAKDTDSNVATAGYVKGAYNAAIKAINKTVDKLDDGVNGYVIDANTLRIQGQDVATQRGVVNTINSATVSSQITDTGDIPITAKVTVMDNWAEDTPNENGPEISTTVNLSDINIVSTISVDNYVETVASSVVETPALGTGTEDGESNPENSPEPGIEG